MFDLKYLSSREFWGQALIRRLKLVGKADDCNVALKSILQFGKQPQSSLSVQKNYILPVMTTPISITNIFSVSVFSTTNLIAKEFYRTILH